MGGIHESAALCHANTDHCLVTYSAPQTFPAAADSWLPLRSEHRGRGWQISRVKSTLLLHTDVFYTQVGFALLGRRSLARMTDGRASQTFREMPHEDWSADDSRL